MIVFSCTSDESCSRILYTLQTSEEVLLDIGDGHVEVRDEIKILGVHLDPTLSMNAQRPSEFVDEE